jgi:prolyl 3-hydroxylase /prolyl 3,4-dihydroxylase
VQPGRSFHDVEEVYTSAHQRLAISGWFHVPQEGEPGYAKVDTSVEEKALSSLEQLTSVEEDKMWSFAPTPEIADYDFNEEDFEFLQKWINEVYLTPDVVEQLHEAMIDESLLELPDFLNPDLAKALHEDLSKCDQPPYNDGWEIIGPPHKQRFRYSRNAFSENLNLMELFEHPAFRKWLYHATGLEMSSQRTVARHFRPGSDYTLATEHKSSSPHLEATLCLTPSALRPKPSGKVMGISAKTVLSTRETGWTSGEFGGYEVYLAPSGDDEADPAVYKAADGDDGVLVSSDAAWNTLTLVLRDTGVLKFVKYVSRAAWGGRWDITSEWRVKDDTTENDEDAILEEEEEWMGIP